MIKRDPIAEIEIALEGDAAAAIGAAGKRLELAVCALVDFDNAGRNRPAERRALLCAAAYALWAYVVQKELIGITDHAGVSEVYGVTPEVWRHIGVFYDETSSSVG